MSALTLRGVDDITKKALQRQAAKAGVSMNRLILDLIEEHVCGTQAGKPRRYNDLDDLIGSMDPDDARAIEETVAEQRHVDQELWQ